MQRQGGILLHRKNEERMSGLKETIVALKIRERERTLSEVNKEIF